MDTTESDKLAKSSSLRRSWQANPQWIRHGLWICFISFGCVVLYSLLQGRPLIRTQLPLSMSLIAVLCLTLVRQRPVLAATLVLISIWWEVTLAVTIAGSYVDPALFVYPVIVSSAGLLLGTRGSIFFAWLSIAGLLTVGLIIGYTFERLGHDYGREGFWLLVAILCMGSSILLTRAAMRSYSELLFNSECDRLLYQGLFEHLPDGLIGLDAQGRVLQSNEAAAQLLGTGRLELVGQPIATVLGKIGFGDGFDLALARERQQTIEVTAGTRQDQQHAYELIVQPTKVPETPSLLLIRDVTQRRLIEQHLGHAQRLEAVGQLAGGIAHDFNNLLTAIGGSAELITQDGDPNSRESANLILAAQRRGSNLTRQLLAFARRDVHQPHDIDLAATVAGMSALIERLLGRKHSLQLDCSTPSWINADTAQIEQLLLNLSTNARDAMADGGPIRVAVRTMDADQAKALGSRLDDAKQSLLEVTDTGCGIPPEILARIFEPFFTTKPRGKGTGLGLAAAQGIVAQNQGFLALDSKVGRGTSMRIFFPSVADRDADLSLASKNGSSRTPSGRGHILVVDDEEIVRETTMALLRSEGYTVVGAADGHHALELLGKSDRFDLVIADLAMPEMDGRELWKRIQARSPDLPVLLMSGYFNDPGVANPNLAVSGGYLAKPFSREHLLNAVHLKLRHA